MSWWMALRRNDPNAVTLGEVYRRQESLERTTREGFKALDDRMASTVMPRDLFQAEHSALSDKVADLEQRFAEALAYRRTLVIAVMVALVGSLGSFIGVLVK